MHRFRLFLRLLRIQRILMRFGLDQAVASMHLWRPLGWLQKAAFWRRSAEGPVGQRLRKALEALGPVFVKFGQAVSVRRDLLPADIADELALLQDHVPPFDGELAAQQIERALGLSLDDAFESFETTPLAAASIAQVHAARLVGGQEVVVKVLRPDVGRIIARDVELLYAIAGLAERYWPGARRLRPVAVVAEFEKTLENELDLMREAGSAAQLKRNFDGSAQLYVPQVYWDLCRRRVLTLERIHGVPIGDVARLKAEGVNIKRLAENGVDIFFTQVFRHNFFHADMHPGNIFVDISVPEAPKYVAVDFGIMGSLTDADQHYLAENFLAFFRRDYRRVAALHVESGWVPPDTRVDELEAAVRTVCEPIFDKPLKEISFGLVLLRLFETARRFNMEVQPQLVLLQKTLLAIEGLGRELYPELDLWTTAKPILEDWMRERRHPAALAKRLVEAWPRISDDLFALPDLLHARVRALREPATEIENSVPERSAERLLIAGGISLLCGTLWGGLYGEPIWVAWLLLGAGALALVIAVTRR